MEPIQRKGRRPHGWDEATGGVEEDERRKRAPPANFVRTQFGNPVHLTGGWARNADDVLMQAAAERARQPPKPKPSGPSCRVCEVTEVNFYTCLRCRRNACQGCARQCQRCGNIFCEFCSAYNYKAAETRVFCIDCDILE